MIDGVDPITLLASLAYSGLSVITWLLVIIAAVRNWDRVRPVFRKSILVGLVLLLLQLPGMIAVVAYLELPGPAADSMAATVGLWIGLAIGWCLAIVTVFHVAAQAALGEAARKSGDAFPVLLRVTAGRFEGWGLGILLGVSSGVLSVILFRLLGARPGEMLRVYQELFPGLQTLGPMVSYGIVVPAMVAAGIGEEILFRGVVQGWLARWFGGDRAAIMGAIVLASTFWALGHAGVTDLLGVKLLQIFLLGLVFGVLAHRYSVETSIMAHVSLNLTVVLLG